MIGLDTKKTHHSRRSIITVILFVFTACLILAEVYLHTYMNSLPVLSIPEAYQQSNISFEGTRIIPYNIHGCSIDWLMFYRIEKPTSLHLNYAFMSFYKVVQNNGFWIQTLDIRPIGLEYKSNDTESHLYASLDSVLYANNCTGVRIRYDLGEIGTYKVDFDLICKVYAKTLLGYLSIDEITISVGETLRFGL